LFWVAFLKQSLKCLLAASTIVNKSQGASAKDEVNMPLTQKVTFKTVLQKGNRVQVPKLVRWQFKMETDQVLKIGIGTHKVGIWCEWESFYGKMGKDGRILIPKLMLALLRSESEKPDLTGYVMEVTLEPA
jgi:hypothetical protein